jgi:toxin ParE1/3/4
MRIVWTEPAADMPERGRIGLAENTRELIFAPWPYIAVYEVSESNVTVLRIRHASQNWP